MKTFLTLFASAALTLSAAAHAETPTSLTEGFDDVDSLSGWVLDAGTTGWFQGNELLGSQAGAAGSHIGANFNSADLETDLIDSWLISPEFSFAGGTRLTFYTRDSAEEGYSDTLDVLFSAGSGTATSGFTTSLFSITGEAYPDGWTRYTYDFTGTGTGRIGFHYTGDYETASYIGIDSVAIAAVPEPSTWMMLGLGLGAVGFAARRSRRAAAGAGLALAALGMSQGAMAHDTVQANAQVNAQANAKDKGMVIVRDAETGELRAPTPEEYRALVPTAAAAHERKTARGIVQEPQVQVTKNGTRKVNVADRAMYSVLTRNADGTLTETCVTGEAAANALVNNTRTAQAKEQRYEAQ
ncbi:choice-of-anchor J family PEP-CTERM protein [Pseudoduganella albidiflava]|uniref:PEP-CTERM sorting domain-containing protein n=1 Tax=Pseudoduganella albidiflava TaxID=321983 RepID=A0A411WXV8_9BURK|nr:choice-of-anchor J domain-containing protein [Pseudoduganella albidiflava]QBI01533.1 PEP-CTERM sorting domain-containing protein [Pseudoduganella albidiflava]GGY34975.1 hypothetical protein GCM10007387_16180 [Pseudoduganella albidiflava]